MLFYIRIFRVFLSLIWKIFPGYSNVAILGLTILGLTENYTMYFSDLKKNNSVLGDKKNFNCTWLGLHAYISHKFYYTKYSYMELHQTIYMVVKVSEQTKIT